MRAMARTLIVLAGCMVVAGCAGDRGRLQDGLLAEPLLKKLDLEYYWQISLALEPKEVLTKLYVIDEHLYCLSNYNRLFAVDAMHGDWKWTYEVADPSHKVYRPVHGRRVAVTEEIPGIAGMMADNPLAGVKPVDAVMINTPSYVVVLNRKTGELLRKVQFALAANTGGATDGQRFYVGSAKGLYHAFGLQEAIRLWSLYTADVLTAPLEVYSEQVYVAGEDSTFRAARAADKGEKVWSKPLGGSVTAAFHVDQRGCFVPCNDGRLYAFVPENGADLWADTRYFICQGPLERGVQVAQSTIFQRAERDKLYAIDLTKGTERWSMAQGLDVLAVIDGTVYLRDVNNNLLLVDEILGEVRSTVPLTGFDLFARNTAAEGAWVATRDGHLACIRPR